MRMTYNFRDAERPVVDVANLRRGKRALGRDAQGVAKAGAAMQEGGRRQASQVALKASREGEG